MEAIFNFWYIYDLKGFIYELRGRMYLGQGTDELKLSLLRQFCNSDYLIAKKFNLPASFNTSFYDTNSGLTVSKNVIQYYDLGAITNGNISIIFEEVFKHFQSELPSESQLIIPVNPLVIITPLINENGNIIIDHKGTIQL
jgi:hypothetical protein